LVGLNFSPKVIKDVGRIAAITGAGQIIFTFILGYFIALIFKFPQLSSLYIAIALTFSSTIIIMKLLSDKDDVEKLHGKVSMGILLVQDFVAMLAMMVIASLMKGAYPGIGIILIFAKGIALIAGFVLFTRFILLGVTDFLLESQEFLFLFVIVWGLGLAFLFQHAGLSMEIGALIAGILLSSTTYNYAIASKLKILRDFFIIFFFVFLGSNLVFKQNHSFILISVLFSVFILVFKPLIVMFLMGISGYSKRTSFHAGLTVAQISEFSLILTAMGVKAGHISENVLSFVTLVGIITIAGSSYMVLYSDKIYPVISKYLSIFERKQVVERELLAKKFSHFLIGYNRTGFAVLKSLQKLYSDILVVDFNPVIIKNLRKRKVNCVYGDAEDVELLEALRIARAHMVISTVPDFSTNLLLIRFMRDKNKEMVLILTARQISDALILYENGADYVILPHFLGGRYAADLIEKFKTHRENYVDESDRQIQELMERIVEGQEHPAVEKEIE